MAPRPQPIVIDRDAVFCRTTSPSSASDLQLNDFLVTYGISCLFISKYYLVGYFTNAWRIYHYYVSIIIIYFFTKLTKMIIRIHSNPDVFFFVFKMFLTQNRHYLTYFNVFQKQGLNPPLQYQ